MLKPNISPKSPRIELSNDSMPNGNFVKFSHTNRKHFTVGNAMAFPIVKMGNKKPPKLPPPITRRGPPSNTAMPRPPHAPLQTTAPTVEALSHTYAVKSPLVTMESPKCVPKSTPYHGPIAKPHLPHPWTRPNYDAKRHPDAIRRFCKMHWTDRPTEHSQESLTTVGRCAPRATRPNNNKCHLVLTRSSVTAEMARVAP